MKSWWLVTGVCVAACSTSPETVEPAPKEVVLAEPFDMFPIGWDLTGVSWDVDIGIEWDVGDSPPSIFLAWDNDATLKMGIPFASQTLEAGVDAAIHLEAAGMQELTLLLRDDAMVPVAYATLRLLSNDSDGSPNVGYPAGETLEAVCGFEAPAARTASPVTARAGMHQLHIIIDERGARCGVDGIDLTTGSLDSVTATISPKLDAQRMHSFAGKARVDNLRVLQGTP